MAMYASLCRADSDRPAKFAVALSQQIEVRPEAISRSAQPVEFGEHFTRDARRHAVLTLTQGAQFFESFGRHLFHHLSPS